MQLLLRQIHKNSVARPQRIVLSKYRWIFVAIDLTQNMGLRADLLDKPTTSSKAVEVSARSDVLGPNAKRDIPFRFGENDWARQVDAQTAGAHYERPRRASRHQVHLWRPDESRHEGVRGPIIKVKADCPPVG